VTKASLIDLVLTGISKLIKKISDKASLFQTGFIYDYAFAMLIGLSILLTYLILN
jgi:NADH-quinone oxidoreductase subunit L